VGRLSAVAIAALAFGVVACDEPQGNVPPPPPTSGRSNAVAAKSSDSQSASGGHAASTTKPAVTAAATATAAPTAPRQLCAGQSPRPAPKPSAKTAAAPGATPPSNLLFGAGKWVWVNLWAAWCVPCKQEMPLLLAWQKKLSASGVLLDLAFVSVDDDDRQLQRFLEGQPPDGVRATHRLPEGPPRTTFLSALGLKEPPDLPAHALVAPSGQISCVIQGAVEERDYPALAALLGAR
jgi:thiol-disulfide isomerase/thioredoxin